MAKLATDAAGDDRFESVGEHVSIFRRGRFWHANFQVDGKQHRRSLKTVSKKEARSRAIRLEAEILEGRFAETMRAPSFKSLTEAYLDYLKTERKAQKTIKKCELVVRRVRDLASRRKAKTISNLNLRFVDAYRKERVAAGAKPKTILNESVIIRQMVNFALSREMIKVDPLKNLKLKKVKMSTQPCWTRTEVERIVGSASEPQKAPLQVLGETGMRIGELKWLTWVDVDFERGIIYIRPKSDWQPKTGDQRAIPMSPALRKLLEAQPRSSQWVFTAPPSKLYPNGDHQISERRLLQYLKRLLKKLGLPGHLHTFRHAFISHALTQGIPEAIVRQWVGHVDADIMRHYTHISDAASAAAMKRLAGM